MMVGSRLCRVRLASRLLLWSRVRHSPRRCADRKEPLSSNGHLTPLLPVPRPAPLRRLPAACAVRSRARRAWRAFADPHTPASVCVALAWPSPARWCHAETASLLPLCGRLPVPPEVPCARARPLLRADAPGQVCSRLNRNGKRSLLPWPAQQARPSHPSYLPLWPTPARGGRCAPCGEAACSASSGSGARSAVW